jgi:hypothetical protein
MKLLTSALLSICFLNLYSQKSDSLRLSINIVPQYLIINGIRSDFEYKLNQKTNVFAGMQYYDGTANQNGAESADIPKSNTTADLSKRNNDKVNGLGWNAGAKYYFQQSPTENYYIGVEAIYNNYNFKLKDYDYFPYVDDGLTFYEYRLGDIDANVSQMAYNVTSGITVTKKRLVLNAWLGVGYTQRKTSESFTKYRKYDGNAWNYAYQYWTPQCGFKIGFLLF